MSDMHAMDWRTMDAGRALDRLIAERLGWRVVSNFDPEDNETVVRLYRPDGVCLGVDYDCEIEEFWDFALQEQNLPGSIPAYSTDANAALTLLDYPADYEFTRLPDGDYFFQKVGGEKTNQKHERLAAEWGKTLPLAICRAFLQWHDAHAT